MGTQPLRAGIASKSRSGLASVVTCVKPKRAGRYGESWESRRSSQATACDYRCVVNAGDPLGSWAETAFIHGKQVDLARMGNQDTEPSWSLPIDDTPVAGRRAEPRQRGRRPRASGESDHLIVLRDGRADHMGKGVTVIRSLQRKLAPDNVGPELDEPTSRQAISTGHGVPSARVSVAEEPGAGKPLAGICAGGAG